MIEIENLTKIYEKGKINSYKALNNVSLKIEDGEFVSIVGKSGAGKSTLLHIIGCIDDFDGTYRLNGKDVSSFNDSECAAARSDTIGIILQDFALLDKYTVLENVMLPFSFSGKKRKKSECRERALNILNEVSMREFADKTTSRLSGGQKQRVAIARAMVNEPSVLLADEPTGALDEKTSAEIMQLLRTLNKGGTTVIVVTHDMEIAHSCDRVIEIKDGTIIK